MILMRRTAFPASLLTSDSAVMAAEAEVQELQDNQDLISSMSSASVVDSERRTSGLDGPCCSVPLSAAGSAVEADSAPSGDFTLRGRKWADATPVS